MHNLHVFVPDVPATENGKGPEDRLDQGDVPGVPHVPDFPARAGVFDEIEQFLQRFIAYPNDWASTAHTLWIAHAHVVEAFDNTPRIAFLSPEPGSGKSRAMELTEALVPRPVLSVNASTAYVFRKISDEAGLPTLLFDEADAIFTGSKNDGSEDLRGLMNSGYRAGAVAGRAAVRGKEVVTEEWPSFCALALAGLNKLPDTLMTRSVVIQMKRRRPDQVVEPYRRRVTVHESTALFERLGLWAEGAFTTLQDSWPQLPKEVQDRDADVWEPLIAVADHIGGDWPERARNAAVEAIAEAKDKPASLGVQLLADIRRVFGDNSRLSTSDLIFELVSLDTAPWESIKGEPIDARFLSNVLGKYGIKPTQLRVRGEKVRGYDRGDFLDAWARYCPERTPAPESAVHPVHPVHPAHSNDPEPVSEFPLPVRPVQNTANDHVIAPVIEPSEPSNRREGQELDTSQSNRREPSEPSNRRETEVVVDYGYCPFPCGMGLDSAGNCTRCNGGKGNS